MRSAKKWSQLILWTLFALIFFVFIFYLIYLTPRKRAESHLGFIHDSINQMHPALLDDRDTAFHDWHVNGLKDTKKLLSLVHTQQDEEALIRFYLAGYKDSHLNGYFDHKPYELLNSSDDIWAGWLLKATTKGYLVVYSKNAESYPPENAILISCDGYDIDAFLRQHYAPFIDLRWQILKARDKAAQALTLSRSDTGILNRPTIKECTFLVEGKRKTYKIKWSSISEKENMILAKNLYQPYRLPLVFRLDEDTLWINVSDFQLNTVEAAESQTKLLMELSSINEMKTVILDTRGNLGGNSTHGFNILSAIFSKYPEAKNYFLNHLQFENQGSPGLFRVSWQFYWSYDYMFKKTIAVQGAQSAQAVILQDLLSRLKHALDSGEKSFSTNKDSDKDNRIPAPDNNWTSPINLVLITDKNCMSACLDFVDFAKVVPNLLHLGEPTDADTSYTQVADMQSKFSSESFIFRVPIKMNKRQREDNKPYIPDVIYEGNINDDKLLKPWVINQVEQYFTQVKRED